MTISQLNQWASFGQSVATIAAIILGGWWAYYHFRRKREHLWNIECSISSSVTSCSKKHVLACLVIDFKNVGSKVFVPGSEGLTVAIRRVVLPDSGPLPDWETCETVLDSIDILAKYKPDGASDYVGVYSLGVGAAYRERFHVVLESGYLYLVKTALTEHRTDDRITDYFLLDALHAPR